MSGVQVLVCADVLCKQRRNPSCGQHENEVEERIVVLCVRLFVIVAVMRALIIFVIGVFIQRGCRQGTGFDCTAESLSTHGAAAFGLCRNQVVAALLSFDRRVAATALARAKS